MTSYAYPSLRERVVLVTGGGSGIGASIVDFCAQGSRVAFLDIDRSASERLCGEIAAAGRGRPLFLHCDLRDVAALRAAIADVRRQIGPIRVLVNNAAHDERRPLDAVTPEYWDERFAVNLRHQFRLGVETRTAAARIALTET